MSGPADLKENLVLILELDFFVVEAAREIARQLRLRDVGGIIVCDFIDMDTKSNRDKVLQELRTHLGRDRARTKALAVSELGLVEMTRQRVRPSLWHSMTTDCPTCAGTGRVRSIESAATRSTRPGSGRLWSSPGQSSSRFPKVW